MFFETFGYIRPLRYFCIAATAVLFAYAAASAALAMSASRVNEFACAVAASQSRVTSWADCTNREDREFKKMAVQLGFPLPRMYSLVYRV